MEMGRKFGLIFRFYWMLYYLGTSIQCFGDDKLNFTNSTEAYIFDCFNIANIENGNWTIVTVNSQDEIHFACFPGYKLVGISKIVCNDQWDKEPKPHCIQVGCEEPAMLVNGELRVEGYKEGQLYPEGVAAVYKCISGYHLRPSSRRRICHNSRWTGANPVCHPDGCPKPDPLLNGHYVPETEACRFPVNAHLYFSCAAGFQLQGVATVQCETSGHWSHPIPQCIRPTRDEGISCPPPLLDPHVEVIAVRGLQSANSAMSGTTLEASCGPGYRDQVIPCVPSLLRCIDGNWQGRFANCGMCRFKVIHVTVDSCMHPFNIPHATVLKVGLESSVFPLGSQVAYSCHPEFQLTGDAVFTCGIDGCWNPEILPVCHPRHSNSHLYINTGAWSDYIKFNTSLMVSMVTIISLSVVVLTVCMVVVCRPHQSTHPPAPLTQPAADPDRVALIAFADGVQSVLPTYEEAVRGSVMNCRVHRPHWTSMLGGQRRNNNRQSPSVRDSMGSTDTVTVSEVSTNVTVDTVSSHSGSQTASCHAICGSLASFDTSSVINTDGVPLLEVNELEEVTTNTADNEIAHDPDCKLQADIASIHS